MVYPNNQALQSRRILFFTAGEKPTTDEITLANAIQGQVEFRAPPALGAVAGFTTEAVNQNLNDYDGTAKGAGVTVPEPYDTLDDLTPVDPGP